jgi:hypothetical protein
MYRDLGSPTRRDPRSEESPGQELPEDELLLADLSAGIAEWSG